MQMSGTLQNAYAALGVSPLDDFALVRAAWVRKVKTFHPDVWHGNTAQATRRLMALNDAYDLLAKHHKQIRAEHEADIEAAMNEQRAAAARKARQQRPVPANAPALRKAQRPRATTAGVENPAARDFARAQRIMNDPQPVTQLAML